MNKFLERHELQKLTQQETDDMNRLIISKRIELVISKRPTKESQASMACWWSLPNIQTEINQYRFFTNSMKENRRVTLPTHSMESVLP